MELLDESKPILDSQNEYFNPLGLINSQPLQIHLSEDQLSEGQGSTVLLENIESVMTQSEHNVISIDINEEITGQETIILDQLEINRSASNSTVILEDILGEIVNHNSHNTSVEISDSLYKEHDSNKKFQITPDTSVSSKEVVNNITTNGLKDLSILNDETSSDLLSKGIKDFKSGDDIELNYSNSLTEFSDSGSSVIYIEDIGQVNSKEIFETNNLLIVNQDGTLTPVTTNNISTTNSSMKDINEENSIFNENKCCSTVNKGSDSKRDCIIIEKCNYESLPLSSSKSSISSGLPAANLNKKYDILPKENLINKGMLSDVEIIQSTSMTENSRGKSSNSSCVPVQSKSYGCTRMPQRSKLGSITKLGSYDQTASSFEDDDADTLLGPAQRWSAQPKSYYGARHKEQFGARKNIKKVGLFVDTDGETSGMGSSVDEQVESSTESASEGSVALPATAFLYPRPSTAGRTPQPPQLLKKRRGGWPKGRKRKPEIPGVKPPKAPITAYVLFLNERRKFYKDNNPEYSFGEVTKILGATWSSMSEEQKTVYVNRSDQDKRRYRNELQAYRQSNDYQLLLRKKRIKNVMRRGGATTEESSDFTDEIDDDDSEELYCRVCDQWFTSLHNKREHLYGKTHLQAITGEYQRERIAEEERALAAGSHRSPERTLTSRTLRSPERLLISRADSSPERLINSRTLRSPERSLVSRPHGSPERILPLRSSYRLSPERASTSRSPHRSLSISADCCSNSDTSTPIPGVGSSIEDESNLVIQSSAQYNLQISPGQSHVEEEEHDGDKEDEEDDDYDESEINESSTSQTSITSAIEGLLSNVVEREKELQSLKVSASKSYKHHLDLASTLLDLKNREKVIRDEQHRLDEENQALKADADVLWMLPALFGVTPLDMVNITMKEDQQILNLEENEDSGVNTIDST